MKRIPYTIDKIKFTLPYGWAGLTLREWMDMRFSWDKSDYIRLLEILSGVPYDTWYSCRVIDLDKKVNPILSMITTSPDWEKLPVPSLVTLGGTEIKVPKDLKLETFGQKSVLQIKTNKAQDEYGDPLRALPEALAIYFQPQLTGKPFDGITLEEIIPLVMEMPILEAYPVGTFFLINYGLS